MTIRSLQEPIEALMEGRFCSQAVHGLQAGTRQDTKHTNTQIQIHKCKNINTYAGITYIPRCDPKGLGNSVLAKCSLDAWLGGRLVIACVAAMLMDFTSLGTPHAWHIGKLHILLLLCNTFILSSKPVRSSQWLTLGSVITEPPHYGPSSNKGFPVKKYGRPYPWFYSHCHRVLENYMARA